MTLFKTRRNSHGNPRIVSKWQEKAGFALADTDSITGGLEFDQAEATSNEEHGVLPPRAIEEQLPVEEVGAGNIAVDVKQPLVSEAKRNLRRSARQRQQTTQLQESLNQDSKLTSLCIPWDVFHDSDLQIQLVLPHLRTPTSCTATKP